MITYTYASLAKHLHIVKPDNVLLGRSLSVHSILLIFLTLILFQLLAIADGLCGDPLLIKNVLRTKILVELTTLVRDAAVGGLASRCPLVGVKNGGILTALLGSDFGGVLFGETLSRLSDLYLASGCQAFELTIDSSRPRWMICLRILSILLLSGSILPSSRAVILTLRIIKLLLLILA